METLVLRGAVGVDGGADDSHLIGCWDHFKTAALQRAHLDHFMQQPIQQSDVDEFRIRAGDEKGSRAFHVDAGCGGSSHGAVTKRKKLRASHDTRPCAVDKFLYL